jgi:hypothetical protein
MSETPPTRREVLCKAVYVTPAILTLPVLLSFASAGSGAGDADEQAKDKHKQAKDKHKQQ